MTYAMVACVFLAVATVPLVLAALRRRPSREWWWSTASTVGVLLVLTAVFDNLMIAADLFRFDDDQLLGLEIGRAPVEDFAWPLAAGMGLPSLWLLLVSDQP